MCSQPRFSTQVNRSHIAMEIDLFVRYKFLRMLHAAALNFTLSMNRGIKDVAQPAHCRMCKQILIHPLLNLTRPYHLIRSLLPQTSRDVRLESR